MSQKESNQARYRLRIAYLQPRYWLSWLGLGVFSLMAFLPMAVLDFLGERLGRLAAKKNRKRFHIVRTNLSLCFPDKSAEQIEHMVYRAFEAQFRSLLHYCVLWWRPEFLVRKTVCKQGFEQLERLRAEGKNVIVLLSHHVGLDFAAASVSMDFQASSVYKTLRNPVMNWKMANGRMRFGSRYGSKLFTREDGLMPLVRETRRGAVLVYLADEDLGAQHSVFASFFGIPKATLPVLGRLAQSCRALVLPCIACYDRSRRCYQVNLLAPVAGLSADDEDRDAQVLSHTIEKMVLQCPEQYLWALRYFQTRPEGEASLYEQAEPK